MKPRISSGWDSILTYEEHLERTLFAIGFYRNDAVKLVFREDGDTLRGVQLSHDRDGVTYGADFATQKSYLDEMVHREDAYVTQKVNEAVLIMSFRAYPELYSQVEISTYFDTQYGAFPYWAADMLVRYSKENLWS